MEHRIRTKIPHAIPTRPDPTPTQNPQNSNDQVSNHETPAKELHANLLGRQVQLPRNLARNSIGQSFNRVRKRCNPNDLNSMFERVAGELRAKLLGGGGAWPGFETTRQATPRNASAAGVEGAGGTGGPGRGTGGRRRGLAGLRDDAPSEARGADGSRAGRRPPAHTAARPNSTPRNANARQPRGAAARSRSQSSTQRSRCATTSATWTAFRAAPLRRLSPETTRTRPRLPSTA